MVARARKGGHRCGYVACLCLLPARPKSSRWCNSRRGTLRARLQGVVSRGRYGRSVWIRRQRPLGRALDFGRFWPACLLWFIIVGPIAWRRTRVRRYKVHRVSVHDVDQSRIGALVVARVPTSWNSRRSPRLGRCRKLEVSRLAVLPPLSPALTRVPIPRLCNPAWSHT